MLARDLGEQVELRGVIMAMATQAFWVKEGLGFERFPIIRMRQLPLKNKLSLEICKYQEVAIKKKQNNQTKTIF
ncbi:hypothetical protein [Acidovorax sp. LjRoot117]|uniref:hypothetical protein n=1 Tax=Acidovorax sp. LjRoot117 TaxID=3342255 RepID=UPI003ECFE018